MAGYEASVAIIGAGIGGLAAAAIMERWGIRADVYEQAPAFGRVGAGINLSANATRVLAGLGMLDTLRAISHVPPTWQSRVWDSGELMGETELGPASEARFGAPFLQAHRADLHGLLAAAVPQDRIHLGKKLVGLETAGNAVTLRFTDGSTARTDAVIGADGIHSRVRDIIIGKEELSFTGRVAYRGVIPTERLGGVAIPPFAKWWGPDRHIVTYYISAGREVYYTTSVPADGWTVESWSAQGDVQELRNEFAGFHPCVQAVLNGCDVTYKWALYDREPLTRPWWADNVAIMGDACHPMVPYMAQGAAMAMEDAVVLARSVKSAGDWSTAFRMFQATREARTGKMQRESGTNKFLRSGGDPSSVYAYDAWTIPLVPASAA